MECRLIVSIQTHMQKDKIYLNMTLMADMLTTRDSLITNWTNSLKSQQFIQIISTTYNNKRMTYNILTYKKL